MLRALWISGLIVAGTMMSSGGCRSCDTCHDYSRPVADCECGACGCERAGSVSSCYSGQCGLESADGPILMEEYEEMPPAE